VTEVYSDSEPNQKKENSLEIGVEGETLFDSMTVEENVGDIIENVTTTTKLLRTC
jgi:hypothetical protein